VPVKGPVPARVPVPVPGRVLARVPETETALARVLVPELAERTPPITGMQLLPQLTIPA